MSEKALEILTRLGITADLSAEDVDIDAIVNETRTKIADLVKSDGDFLEPIKAQVKSETSIVAAKKAKKALNEKWGLGMSNKELDETDYDALLDMTYEKSKQSTTAEVNTLQEQIIALTNKAKEIEDAAESKVKEVEKQWAEKYLGGRRSEIAAKAIGELELIISKDKAARFAELDLKDKGYHIDFDADGNAVVMQGEYAALKPDKTGKLSVNEAYALVLDEFVKKSNGAPQAQPNSRLTSLPENLHPAMAQRLKEMEAKFQA